MKEEALQEPHSASASLDHTRLALHRVVEEVDGRAITATGEVVNAAAYSLFKYGNPEQAGHYAGELAKLLLESPVAARFDHDQPLVVSASAYKRLETAAQLLANGVSMRLNWAGYNTQNGRIRRSRLTEGDYATMSATEREFWMANNGLSADASVFRGRHAVVIDDICITGSHERSICQLFSNIGVASLTSLYVMELDPALAARDTRIEDRLNHARIKTLEDLLELMRSMAVFVPTARVVKFVLNSPADVLKRFLGMVSCAVLRHLHAGLLDDGYYKMDSYRTGVELVIAEVTRRKHDALKHHYNGEWLNFDQNTWTGWDPTPFDAILTFGEEPSWPKIPEFPPPQKRIAKSFSLGGLSVTFAANSRRI